MHHTYTILGSPLKTADNIPARDGLSDSTEQEREGILLHLLPLQPAAALHGRAGHYVPDGHLGHLAHGGVADAAFLLGVLRGQEGVDDGGAESGAGHLGAFFADPRPGLVVHLEGGDGPGLAGAPRQLLPREPLDRLGRGRAAARRVGRVPAARLGRRRPVRRVPADGPGPRGPRRATPPPPRRGALGRLPTREAPPAVGTRVAVPVAAPAPAVAVLGGLVRLVVLPLVSPRRREVVVVVLVTRQVVLVARVVVGIPLVVVGFFVGIRVLHLGGAGASLLPGVRAVVPPSVAVVVMVVVVVVVIASRIFGAPAVVVAVAARVFLVLGLVIAVAAAGVIVAPVGISAIVVGVEGAVAVGVDFGLVGSRSGSGRRHNRCSVGISVSLRQSREEIIE